MKKFTINSVIVLIFSVLFIAIAVFAFQIRKIQTIPERVACSMEAKLCPDGSAVGRSGPDCAFAPCPGSESIPPKPIPVSLDCNGAGEKCPNGYTCIQKCGPPVVRDDEPAPGYYCELNAIASKPRMCPICLASNTLISTPKGEVSVKEIAVGTDIWSVNKRGERIISTVKQVSHMDAPKSHQVIHLVLSDKREVWLSPNHPMTNGLPVKNLRIGDTYDGARVLIADLVSYWDKETYDLLPSGDTGAYFANGILFGSTLRNWK